MGQRRKGVGREALEVEMIVLNDSLVVSLNREGD